MSPCSDPCAVCIEGTQHLLRHVSMPENDQQRKFTIEKNGQYFHVVAFERIKIEWSVQRGGRERPHGLAVGRHEALLLPLLLLHLVLALRLAHSCPSGSLHLQVRDNLRLVTCLTFAAARVDQTGCHPDCRPSPPWIRYEIVFSSGIHSFHPIDI